MADAPQLIRVAASENAILNGVAVAPSGRVFSSFPRWMHAPTPSLAEALLWKAGVIGTPGSIERGTTISDFDPLEKKAQRSLNSSLINFRHGGAHAYVIDTPGGGDFVGQSLPALEAVETAAVVISAWYGGGGPGVVATIFAAIAASDLVFPATWSLSIAKIGRAHV